MSEIPWFKVDDNLAFHHKVIAAGNPALGLWVRAGSMCAQQLTDGYVSDLMAATLGTKSQAERLVAVGLWDRVDGGYSFHEWADRQPSKVDVEAERAAAKDRMRKARAAKRAASEETSPQVSGLRSASVRANNSRTNGGTSPEVRVTPTRPDPTRPTTSGGDGKPSAQIFVAEWIEHCDERPPSRVVGQVSREIKQLIDDEISPQRIRAGLAAWSRKTLHPSALASVVHEVSRQAPTTPLAQVGDIEAPPDGLTDDEYAAWCHQQAQKRRA